MSPNQQLCVAIIERVEFLHAHEFQVYTYSGSDPQATRFAAAKALDIPPENIVGTPALTERAGEPFVRKHQFVNPLKDVAGKTGNIRNKIGRVPVLAVGNSRGHLEMLNYSKPAGPSLQLIVNHDDPDREYEYSADKMKKRCAENDWIEISMKKDIKTVFDGLE